MESTAVPDARVAAAIAHWGPRLTAQGVDANDFLRTTAAIEHWSEWLDAWCRTGDEHAALARAAEADGFGLTAGEAWVRAALSYHFAQFVWLLDAERRRAAARLAIASLYAAHRHLDASAERLEILCEGSALYANLRRPPGGGRSPLVLLLPGLDSAKEEFFHWENVFLARGMATISLDGPGQGEAAEHTRIRHDYEVATAVTLDALKGRNDVDLTRIGVVGVSLGGYYAPRVAAMEPRITAAAAIGGPFNFGECWDGLPPLTREGFRHAAGAADDEEARALALRLDLGPVLARIRQPFLVVFGRLDRLIPFQQAERVAAGAPRARLVMYPDGNHVCNNIPYKYRPLVGDWMRAQLTATVA
jgi:pimeloyl-ACP methyl ester carboxylesterase